VDRYSFIVRDFHSLLLAGLPALRTTSPLVLKQQTQSLVHGKVRVGPDADYAARSGS
jgi:hypothetical protein